MTDHVTPTDERLAAVAAAGATDDTPVVMLNLNRYRDRAEYPAGTPDAEVSGREAYLRYGAVAYPAILSAGGGILCATNAAQTGIVSDYAFNAVVVAALDPCPASPSRSPSRPGTRREGHAARHRLADPGRATGRPVDARAGRQPEPAVRLRTRRAHAPRRGRALPRHAPPRGAHAPPLGSHHRLQRPRDDPLGDVPGREPAAGDRAAGHGHV